jgi:hypothetical protein
MREPQAVTIVREGNLSVGVQQLSRSHDRSQILDNAKHVLFSTRQFRVPEDGGISFGLSMRVRRRGARQGDLYDGYASFLCLDFSNGLAMDWFLAEDRAAATYARLPFPGLELPEIGDLNYWAFFKEKDLASTPEGFHAFELRIEGSRVFSWWADGEEISRQSKPELKFGDLTLGLAIMTEKDIGPHGSVSVHGQGVQAEWSPITISTW